MKYFFYLILFGLFIFSSLVQAGFDVEHKAYWYLTNKNLKTKEPIAEEMTWRLVTPQGMLLYQGYVPFSNRDKYLKSFQMADQPAWQGYMLAAYAFKEAVTGEDFDDEMSLLADGLLVHYDVTGVQGLLGRNVMPDYQGPRLPFMFTQEQRPTKYWLKGPTGHWFRNGVAKGHTTMAVFGCSIPLALERQGRIQLRDETRQKLINFMMPLVRRLVNNGFYIIDWNGRPTEYGNLGPQGLNGFNMMLMLHMMRSASFYDGNIAKTYKKSLKSWAWRINWSLNILGRSTQKIIGKHHGKKNRPSISDMQHLSLAYLSLYFQEGKQKYMKHIRRGMRGVWKFMRYMRNPMFTIPYAATIRGKQHRINEIIEDLRDFPLEKYETDAGRKVTKKIQPLSNRPFNTNYWKSSPFLQATKIPPRRTGEEQVFSSVDYLLAYWMGRFFNLVPEE